MRLRNAYILDLLSKKLNRERTFYMMLLVYSIVSMLYNIPYFLFLMKNDIFNEFNCFVNNNRIISSKYFRIIVILMQYLLHLISLFHTITFNVLLIKKLRRKFDKHEYSMCRTTNDVYSFVSTRLNNFEKLSKRLTVLIIYG